MVLIAAGVAAVLVLGAGGFLAYQKFLTPPPTPPPPAAKPKAATPTASTAVPKAAGPVPTPAVAPGTATQPSTLDQIAHAPANAVNKAKSAIDARKASGQTNIDGAAAGTGLADKPAVAPSAANPKAPPATGVKSLGGGLSATTPLDAGAEASPEFRSFVANAKISGVFQGAPSRAFINGRMSRSGETVDLTLGIIFDGVDPVKRHLIFKDKSGAIVARKY